MFIRVSMLFLLVVFLSCESKPTLPSNSVPKEKMTSLMIDIYLLEAKLSTLNLHPDSAKKVYRHYEDRLFEKWDIDSVDYFITMKYYIQNPKLLQELNERVVDSLIVREQTSNIY